MEHPFNVIILSYIGNRNGKQTEFNILYEKEYDNYDDALKAYNEIELNSFNQDKGIIQNDVFLIASFE